MDSLQVDDFFHKQFVDLDNPFEVLGKLLDSKETSISYLLRAWERKSKVNDHLEW